MKIDAYLTPGNPLQYPVKTENESNRCVHPISSLIVSKGGLRRGAGGSGTSIAGSYSGSGCLGSMADS